MNILRNRLADLNLVLRYGHGVLRNPDPRFIALQEFCDTRPELLADPVIQLVKKVRSNELSNRKCQLIFRFVDV